MAENKQKVDLSKASSTLCPPVPDHPSSSPSSSTVCSWCTRQVFYYQIPFARKCVGCTPENLYCISCSIGGCCTPVCTAHTTCWQKHVAAQPPHRHSSHQVVDPFASLFVDAVIHSERDEEKLHQLHVNDKFARWFYVKNGDDTPELWVHDRFIRVCDSGRTGNKITENHFPAFVSFIGKTTVGKSTIVRAMLLQGALNKLRRSSEFPTAAELELIEQAKTGVGHMPVPRSGNLEHKTDPTTFGVHLYHDETSVTGSPAGSFDATREEDTQSVKFPLLLADCEGFGAGTAITSAEKFTNLDESDDAGVVKTFITASYAQGGKDGIERFYARVLYAISDVIVYVTSSDTTFQKDLTQVLEWASAAVDKSYNQPSRKTLIVVRNKESKDSEEYTPEDLKRLYLHPLRKKNLWEDSPKLKEFVESHNRNCGSRRAIHDNEQLYKELFRDIRCCYIQDKGESDASSTRALEVYKHFKILRNEIQYAAEEERREKTRGFALYNVPTMTHIIFQVFNHFTKYEGPLDFYRAARRDNPTPGNIKQHMANFLRIALEHGNGKVQGIEDMIIGAVGLMMLIYVQRNFSKDELAPATAMFRLYLKKHWEDGVEIYLTEYERCSYEFPTRNTYCTVRGRYNAHRQHIYSPEAGSPNTTRLLQVQGDFWPHRSWSPADKAAWLSAIERQFSTLYNSVFDTALVECSDDLIQERRHTTQRMHNDIWRVLQSNKTCLACLQAVPDHVLPCGHSYCPRCIQELAKPSRSFECAFDMSGCALCEDYNHKNPHQVQLKPKCAGVRILTLDGGGIRGIVELALLQALHKSVGLGVQISELFDLVVGTSTGGIIGLGLVMAGEPIETLIGLFETWSLKTFKQTRGGLRVIAKIALIFGGYESQYSATPLKEGLSDFFGSERSLFAPAKTQGYQSTARVAVTTARDGGETECLITNYNRPLGDWSRFEREDDAEKDMKIWEAGLATSAAPFHLPPFVKQPGNTDYVDGAVFANCPAKIALEEKSKLWPGEGTSLDVLLSLGTGHQSAARPKIPRAVRYGFFNPILKMFERQLDSNKIWEEVKRTSQPDIGVRLHRLNPEILDERGRYIELYHWQEIQNLFKMTGQWAEAHRAEIQHISNILVANLFFFEPDDTHLPEDGHPFRGSMRCRLQFESVALETLLARVRGFCHTTVERAELPLVGNLPDGRWRTVKDESGSPVPICKIAGDSRTKRFKLDFQLPISHLGAEYQVLAVMLPGEAERIPISGFPATLAELNKRSRSQWLQ